jgi:hypothetical protein
LTCEGSGFRVKKTEFAVDSLHRKKGTGVRVKTKKIHHEEHEEKQGEHEVSSASNCLFINKEFDALMSFQKTSI